MNENPFDVRRMSDPQGLIDDLVGQTSRQCKAIGDLMKEIDRLKILLTEAGIDPGKAPEPKKTRKKKEKVETPVEE